MPHPAQEVLVDGVRYDVHGLATVFEEQGCLRQRRKEQQKVHAIRPETFSAMWL